MTNNPGENLLYSGPGQRIDTRLTTQFPYSRNFFQHILERKGVTVISAKSSATLAIGLKVKKSYKLQDGDQVHIESLERFLDGGILDECPAWDIDVRHDAPDYMVIYKPKGVLSHPNSVRDVKHPSVVGGLYHYFQQAGLPSMGSFIRAGLVHRLDKETDGLMIIAKTEKGLQHFKQLFQQKSEAATLTEKEAIPLKKYYSAQCEITPQGKSFLEKIKDNLPHIIQEDVIPKTPYPVVKEGITKIIGITSEHAASLSLQSGERISLYIEILTGRTHQIRYHLSTYGLSIVGDYVYGNDTKEPMGLTAAKLVFVDPDGEMITLEI